MLRNILLNSFYEIQSKQIIKLYVKMYFNNFKTDVLRELLFALASVRSPCIILCCCAISNVIATINHSVQITNLKEKISFYRFSN